MVVVDFVVEMDDVAVDEDDTFAVELLTDTERTGLVEVADCEVLCTDFADFVTFTDVPEMAAELFCVVDTVLGVPPVKYVLLFAIVLPVTSGLNFNGGEKFEPDNNMDIASKIANVATLRPKITVFIVILCICQIF